MNVSDAISSRMSCRAFLDKPAPINQLRTDRAALEEFATFHTD